ncbi:PKD domain-containing protein [Nocardioides baculatus]|uniref:PKD domain-containing protein n=1 Tax=Nocardioides baculatus TaxID=2801337 RepID=A0ABS1LDU9_9ACTN|nr:PKD domain-containing protein [Nocardioides baculatus]MBL0749742.1 PKD domain-containing protein [Nocardioides baculatus]
MTRVITRLVLVIVTALLGAALVTPPAGAAPTWRPVTNLFADLSAPGAQTPSIGTDAAGSSTVVWSRYDGTRTIVETSYRPVGGTWSAPVVIATGAQIGFAQVAVAPSGGATAVWRSSELDRSVVQASSRSASGTWSEPVTLSSDPSRDLSSQPDVPQVAVDPTGVATATWSRFEAVPGQPWRFTVQTSTQAADGTWSTPVDLSPAGSPARTTDVTVDPAGNATAVWSAGATLQAATRPAGGAWSAPVQLSAAAGPRANPRVVVDPSGTATAVWGSFAGGAYGVQTASRAPGGAWTAPLDLVSGDVFDTPAIAVDRQGNTTALWQQNDGSGWVVTSASRPAGGAWSAPVLLSAPADDSWDPQVAVDLAGNATAIWARDLAGGRVIEAARRPAQGEWSEPIELSARGDAQHPQVAVDPSGNVTAAWSRKADAGWIVQARGLDAAGPVVTGITGTTSRIAARGRAFSVTAHDVWSRVASARWTFPDGTTASGTSVSYAGTTGTRPVRVVLTDSVGNATACSYTSTFTCRATTRIRPFIDRARLSPKKIRAVGSDARVAKKARATITLNTAAKVTFTFRKAGSKRVTLVKKLDAGRNRVTIRARLSARKVLAPGRWKVVVTAKNAVGTSPKASFRLRVVR